MAMTISALGNVLGILRRPALEEVPPPDSVSASGMVISAFLASSGILIAQLPSTLIGKCEKPDNFTSKWGNLCYHRYIFSIQFSRFSAKHDNCRRQAHFKGDPPFSRGEVYVKVFD
jgi:hypothetical protein